MKNLQIRAGELKGKLNPSEQKILEYIIEYPQMLMSLPIAKIAQEIGTSQAGVVRLCKKLGFAGLKDVKASLAENLLAAAGESRPEDEYSDIKTSDNASSVISKVAFGHISAIKETVKVLDCTQFEQAVSLMGQAERIDTFGTGASSIVAQDMQQKLIRIGKNCLCFQDVHLQLTAAASLTKNDVLLLVSYSGSTKEVLDVLQAAKRKGATVVALTKLAQSPLSKQADIVLHVCSAEIAVRSAATSSRIVQLVVVDMLFAAIAGNYYEDVKATLKRSRQNIQERKA